MSKDIGDLLDGFRMLRIGTLYLVLFFIFLIPALLLISFIAETVIGVTFLLLIILGLGFYCWFEATDYLKRFNPRRLGIGRSGMRLILKGVEVSLLPFILTIIYSYLRGVFIEVFGLYIILIEAYLILTITYLFFIGVIIILIGMILFAIMLMRLGGLSKTINISGILLLIAIVITFIPIIFEYIFGVGSSIRILIILVIIYIGSLILIYKGSGEAIASLRGLGG